MNILITGGAGFIGQKVARSLLKKNFNVRVLDNFSPQIHSTNRLPEHLEKNVELIRGDIRNRSILKTSLGGIDKVLHLAAETGTGQSMYDINKYFEVNVQATASLLDLIQNDDCGKSVQSIIVASSRAIYGEGAYSCKTHGTVFPYQRSKENMLLGIFEASCPSCNSFVQPIPTCESAPFLPMSMYGLTKQAQEQAVLLFARTKNINAFALRFQNVYGPGQSLKNPYTGILAIFSNLARQNQKIEIYEDGFESRDFIYIDDVVETIIRSINYSNQYIGSLNVGSGIATSVLRVAEEIKTHFNSDSEIKVTGGFRMGDIRHNIADISQLQEILGFVPEVTFKSGLTNFLNWTTEHCPEDQSAYLRSINELTSRGLMSYALLNSKIK